MSEGKKKCPFCAEEINAEAIKCRYCGEMLTQIDKPANSTMEEGKEVANETMNCPCCNNPLPPQAAQCPHCGAEVASTRESEQKPELYNPEAAALWSLLLTPIFGAYVVKSNWKILGRKQQEKRSIIWLIALVMLVVLTVLVQMWGLVENDKVAGINLMSLLIWYFLECRPQKKYLADNKIDYRKKSWTSLVLKAIGIVALAFLVIFAWHFYRGEGESSSMINDTVKKVINEKILGGKEAFKCTKVTNVESIGKNKYKAKALISFYTTMYTADIEYEVIDDIVQVNMAPFVLWTHISK